MRSNKLCLILFLLFFLSACNDVSYAPVTDINLIEPIPPSGKYVAKAGESLYEIAWRYGLDYRVLANDNALQEPYHLRAGQIINLRNADSSRVQIITTSTIYPEKPTAPSYNVRQAFNSFNDDIQQEITTIQKPRNKAPKWIVLKHERLPKETKIAWAWPLKGRIIHTFSARNKGIDISGNLGDPVYATAAGQVVYCGNGLRAYGNLIIVKHNNVYLSAYGYNKQILVREGEWITQGQKIALVGKGFNDDNTMLHFEIRWGGESVNPITLLQR